MRPGGSFLVAAFAAGALAAGAAATTAPAFQRSERVELTAAHLRLSAARVPARHGLTLVVVFDIRNESRVTRRFAVGLYRSPPIRPGQTLNASVAFVKRGTVVCRALAADGRALRATFRIV